MQRPAIVAAGDLSLGVAGGSQHVVAKQRVKGVEFGVERLDAI